MSTFATNTLITNNCYCSMKMSVVQQFQQQRTVAGPLEQITI